MDFNDVDWIDKIPEDVWIILLGYMPDYRSIINCAIASPYFGTLLLQHRKAVSLFPEIRNIVNQTIDVDFDRTISFEEALRNYAGNFTRHQSLPLRQFQSAIQESPNSERDVCNLNDLSIKELNDILSEIQNNETFFANNNPFPSRHIALVEPHTIPEISLISQYRQKTENILEHFGHHILHASIGIGFQDSDIVTSSEFNTRLRACLQHLPNLQSLEVSSPNVRNDGRRERDSKDELKNINLSNLQPQGFALNLKSTKDLDVLSNEWNLTFLQLLIPACDENQSLLWRNVREKLNFFKNSLGELHLQLPWTSNKEYSAGAFRNSKVSLDLPQLRKLRVVMPHYYSLDFLLGLRSLEFLWIQLNFSLNPKQDTTQVANSTIQFSSHNLSNFLNSNLWQLIPTLQEVCFEQKGSPTVHKFSREHTQSNQ